MINTIHVPSKATSAIASACWGQVTFYDANNQRIQRLSGGRALSAISEMQLSTRWQMRSYGVFSIKDVYRENN